MVSLSLQDIIEIEDNHSQKYQMEIETDSNDIHFLETWNTNIPDDIQIDIWKERGYSDDQIEVIKNGCLFNLNEMASQTQQRRSELFNQLNVIQLSNEMKEEENENQTEEMEIVINDDIPELPEPIELFDYDDDNNYY